MGRVLYGLVFVVVLPAALVAWVAATDRSVGLPAPRWPAVGWMVAGAGVVLMLEAMRELQRRGGGLPMNAFPPPRLVTTGVYALIPHPIYVGFCAACVGVALAMGSPAGLWLVAPATIMGCVALVLGFEAAALRARHGAGPRPLLRPPEPGAGAPTWRDRLAVYPLLFLPWLVLYEGWGHVPVRDAFEAYLEVERGWPVLEWTTFVYSTAYPLALSVPLVPRCKDDLRRFFVAGWVAIMIVMLAYVAIPVASPPREFDPRAVGGWLLALERSDGVGGGVAFPSFHVVWALLAAMAWSRRGRAWAFAGWVMAAGIGVACVTTGMHAVADIAPAVPVAALAWWWPEVWRWLLAGAERVANSWRCRRIGPVRVINYAGYAGLAAGCGTLLVAGLAGPDRAWVVAAVALAMLVCAGLWGQVLVGSPTLLRPFGYFGAVVGAGMGLGAVGLTRGAAELWLLSGAVAATAPWIVLIGRFRCLVQGCCHGHVTPGPGIRYRHPLSRVCRIARLDGVSVHATPVYSMINNAVIGVLLARLWSVGAALSMIVGVYLLLAGLTRFVEESTRGEPQTQVVAGLKVYQWLAVASVIAGAALTAIPTPTAPDALVLSWAAAAWACVVGAAFAFAMGVDFPESNRRFSRLV